MINEKLKQIYLQHNIIRVSKKEINLSFNVCTCIVLEDACPEIVYLLSR